MTSSGHLEACAVGSSRLSTAAPVPFDFEGTIGSHGWAVLEPNRWRPEDAVFSRSERIAAGRVVHLTITSGGSWDRPRVRVTVDHGGTLSRTEASTVRRSVRRMLRLDEDLAPFHDLCRQAGGRWLAACDGRGRLLRSPSLFEDAVKTICTTNVQWGGTKGMVRRLVASLGEPGPLSMPADPKLPNAFPTPESIAASDGATLDSVRLGYRAPYIRELAERVATGELDLDSLGHASAPTEEVRRELLAIKGIGSYGAATLLMLMGRYDYLAIDSVYRSFVQRRYFGGRAVPDAEAADVYSDWGRWKYLGFWFDLWQGVEDGV